MQYSTTQHEINLNKLTVYEQVKFPGGYDDYRNEVVALLQLRNNYLSEKDLLSSHFTNGKALNETTIDQLLQEYPSILRTGHKDKDTGGFMYLDLGADYNVQPGDIFYDSFFIRQLRNTDLLQVYDFLNYHLMEYYDDIQAFSVFLRICIRKHKEKFLENNTIETVNEWISHKEKQAEDESKGLAGIPNGQHRRGRIKREANDGITALNQEQTVLLIYLLQQAKVILKDEYLTGAEAGRAFEILTGYSQNTLRQTLSKISQYHTKANLKDLNHLFADLKLLTDKELKDK